MGGEEKGGDPAVKYTSPWVMLQIKLKKTVSISLELPDHPPKKSLPKVSHKVENGSSTSQGPLFLFLSQGSLLLAHLTD